MVTTVNIKNNNTNINFGWNYKTHGKITEKALEQVPALKEFKSILLKYVQKPDFDERGFLANNHFYYLTDKFHKTLSFADFNGKLNSKHFFEKHIEKAKKYCETNKEKAAQHIARALHFLQDAANPLHTQRGSLIQKIKDKVMHTRFEKMALVNQEELINSYKPKVLPQLTNNEVFMSNVVSSSNSEQVSTNNYTNWHNIAETGIHKSIESSANLLNNIKNLLKSL